jgi:hypothetical protein
MIHATSSTVLIRWGDGGKPQRGNSKPLFDVFKIFRDDGYGDNFIAETFAFAYTDETVLPGMCYVYTVYGQQIDLATDEVLAEAMVFGPEIVVTLSVQNELPTEVQYNVEDEVPPPPLEYKLTPRVGIIRHAWKYPKHTGNTIIGTYIEDDETGHAAAFIPITVADACSGFWDQPIEGYHCYRIRTVDESLRLSAYSDWICEKAGGYLRSPDINLFVRYENEWNPGSIAAESQIANVVLYRLEGSINSYTWVSGYDINFEPVSTEVSVPFNETVNLSEALGWNKVTPNQLLGKSFENPDPNDPGEEIGGLIEGTYKMIIEWPYAKNEINEMYHYILKPKQVTEYFTLHAVDAMENSSIATSSAENPTTVALKQPSYFFDGDSVIIRGHEGSWPDINGTHTLSKINNMTFSIPVNVATAGEGGTATGPERASYLGFYPSEYGSPVFGDPYEINNTPDDTYTVRSERSHDMFFGLLFSPAYVEGPSPGYLISRFVPVYLGLYTGAVNLPIDAIVKDEAHLAELQAIWDTAYLHYQPVSGDYGVWWGHQFGSPNNDTTDFLQYFPGGDTSEYKTVIIDDVEMTTRRPSYVGEPATHIYGCAPVGERPSAEGEIDENTSWNDKPYYSVFPCQYPEGVNYVYYYCRIS